MSTWQKIGRGEMHESPAPVFIIIQGIFNQVNIHGKYIQVS